MSYELHDKFIAGLGTCPKCGNHLLFGKCLTCGWNKKTIGGKETK